MAGACLALLTSLATSLAAQERPVTRDSATLIPGPQFSTTTWVRWLATPLFGPRYRRIWRLPLTLPVLDTAATAGGLRPAGQGVGRSTGLEYFDGADGSKWTFFPLDRTDPHSFPPNLVPASVSAGLVADLTSGRNPAGPLVAASLAEAAEVPNQAAWLVAFPEGDSVRAGYLLRRDPAAVPDSVGPVRPGAVVTSLALLHRLLTRTGERADARGILEASLFDIYVGNLDPRFLLWRWQATADGEGILWRPLGTFRETALSRYNGIVSNLWRPLSPDLVSFGDAYPHTLTGFADQASVYRFILGPLGWATWDSVATQMQARLTDSVIAAAVALMPANYRAEIGERTERALRARRDHLPEAAREMFQQVRRHADVHATAGADAVVAEWQGRDSLSLRVGRQYLAPFLAEETKRVTLYLGGGGDTVHLVGAEGRGPGLRIARVSGAPLMMSGQADKGLVDVYGGGSLPPAGAPADVTFHPSSIADPLMHMDSVGGQRTDARHTYHPTTWLALTSGVGWLIGGGVVRTEWATDTRPYRNQVTLRAAYGSDSKSAVVQLLGDFRFANSPLQLDIDAIASGVGAVYFYGFGNETPGTTNSAYYRAGRDLYALAPSLLLPVSRRTKAGLGVALKSVDTPLDTTLYIGIARPYGSPSFGQAGFTGEFIFDSRDVKGAPRRGVLASVNGGWYPWIRDGSGSFGTVIASVATYLTPHGWKSMTVALRAGGTTTWGSVPYYEAAFIGGGRTVRGLPQGRYEGNQALFGNLDLRLRVSQVQFVLPWDFGILGLADAGRVFVPGEASDVWHPSFGGGLWVALLDRSLAASLNVATGAGQGVFVNAAGGFTF